MRPATAGAPDVSCVVIFLDGARYIEEAISSVVGQAGFDDWELILVDDGSTDGSTAMAKAWAATDPTRIRYVEHAGHQNRGMSASRNLGVTVARGAYIGFLDCDDVWLPSALAHRMRVAAAYPSSDLVVGGTWRWHSWTGNEDDGARDRRMTLPDAPPYTMLPPTRLFSAIYGIPSGGYVPAMCSLLVRRESLLALGGLESEFRDLYEDQVLYVKAGLQLTAVIDPRPLALYRQHPASACEVSISDGVWSRSGPSAPATRFFTWMRSYVGGETGPRSEDSKIVELNIAYNRRRPDQLDPTLSRLLRRFTPESARTAVRWFHRRRGHRRQELVPVSVVGEWSAQHLQVITASMAGTVLVVVPTSPSGEPWASDVPRDAFGSATQVIAQRLEDIDGAVHVDHVVVPFDASVELPLDAMLKTLQPLLHPDGTLVVLMPGRGYRPPSNGDAVSARFNDDAADVATMAGRFFPDAHIAVETFGSPVTALAVAAGSPASEVGGVAIDQHDQQTQVLVTLYLSGLVRHGNQSTDPRSWTSRSPAVIERRDEEETAS